MKTFLATMLLAAALPLSAMAQTPAGAAAKTAPAKSAKASTAMSVKAPASSKSAKTSKVQPRQGKHRVVRPASVKKAG